MPVCHLCAIFHPLATARWGQFSFVFPVAVLPPGQRSVRQALLYTVQSVGVGVLLKLAGLGSVANATGYGAAAI